MTEVDDTMMDPTPFNMSTANTSHPHCNGLPIIDTSATHYDMTGKKFLIIFNHFKFKRTRHFWFRKPSERNGTYRDVAELKRVFTKLGFEIKVHDDLEHDDIMEKLSTFCAMDHSKTSCVAVAILTHGSYGDKICAADKPYKLKDVTGMFENVTQLIGKPKLFFVQACRGGQIDLGHPVEFDGETEPHAAVPKHADFLVIHSTVADHVSYRNNLGSFLVQALCDVIEQYHHTLDMLHMITLMNRTLAFEYKTNPRFKPVKKQMPETRFTLTKFLRL